MTRARWLLTAYVLVVGGLLAWPNGWVLNRLTVRLSTLGLPHLGPQVLPEHYGVALNVLALMILVALLCAAWPRVPPLQWALVATALSVTVEVAQGLLLPGREAGVGDVLANAGGAVLSAAAVRGLRAARVAIARRVE